MKRIKIRINNKKKYGIYSIAGRRQNPSGYGVGAGILPERYMTYFLWVRELKKKLVDARKHETVGRMQSSTDW